VAECKHGGGGKGGCGTVWIPLLGQFKGIACLMVSTPFTLFFVFARPFPNSPSLPSCATLPSYTPSTLFITRAVHLKPDTQAGGLPAAAAPHWTVRPFILWGYRDCMGWRQCWRSLLTVHNETGNVWTHVFGLLLFLFLQVHELLRQDKTLHHRLVASGYILATNFCMATSAVFHLMTPHSKQVYERCLRFDMTGIALVIIASFLVGLHYGYWCHPFLGRLYFSIVGVLSCIALAWPHMPKLLHNFNLSVTFFASFVAFALVPLFHWVSVVGGLSSEQATLFFWKLIATFGLYALGFLFYGAQFPERFYSGKFDIVGHSHQLWHIAVLLGALEFYTAMQAYAGYRETHTCS